MIKSKITSIIIINVNKYVPEQDESVQTVTEAEADEEEPDHHKVEVPIGGNVQLHCPKGKLKHTKINNLYV